MKSYGRVHEEQPSKPRRCFPFSLRAELLDLMVTQFTIRFAEMGVHSRAHVPVVLLHLDETRYIERAATAALQIRFVSPASIRSSGEDNLRSHYK